MKHIVLAWVLAGALLLPGCATYGGYGYGGYASYGGYWPYYGYGYRRPYYPPYYGGVYVYNTPRWGYAGPWRGGWAGGGRGWAGGGHGWGGGWGGHRH
ncbi:MAG: hypothetical protein ACKN9T_10365 [Candidatus Methylumidiphilus sp.]